MLHLLVNSLSKKMKVKHIYHVAEKLSVIDKCREIKIYLHQTVDFGNTIHQTKNDEISGKNDICPDQICTLTRTCTHKHTHTHILRNSFHSYLLARD